MSIASEITRISGNVANSLDAVAAKGVTVPSGSNSDDLAGLIAQISSGGTGAISIVDTADAAGGTVRTITAVDISDTTAAAGDVVSGKYFYTAAGVKTQGSISAGTEGTPTATKGTVSNHSISVTPSVTNTAGVISGGTHSGTAVTVSASELVSGSETKTANGTYDVTNLSELVVNVAGAKTASGTFTGDGSRDITFSCQFEPDVVYWSSDPGTSSSSGVVAGIIVRGMMAATRYRNNSTTNSHYAQIDITGMNTAGSSYSFRATYDSTNQQVTLYCFSSNARTYFVSSRTYSFQCVKYT